MLFKSLILALVIGIGAGNLYAQPKPVTKSLPQMKEDTVRIVSLQHPQQAKQLREQLDKLMNIRGVSTSKVQVTGKKFQRELDILNNHMRNTSAELKKANLDKVKLNQLSQKLNQHIANLKSLRTDLKEQILTEEVRMEDVKNRRQEYMTMFENFDQKANQLFNMLSSVLKSQKDMESGIVRNLR
jgi:chromosome segregation ATPase